MLTGNKFHQDMKFCATFQITKYVNGFGGTQKKQLITAGHTDSSLQTIGVQNYLRIIPTAVWTFSDKKQL